jgi:hypothetical protein
MNYSHNNKEKLLSTVKVFRPPRVCYVSSIYNYNKNNRIVNSTPQKEQTEIGRKMLKVVKEMSSETIQ